MSRIFSFIVLMAFSTLSASPTVDLSTQEGEERLMLSSYSNDYWRLNSHYLSQRPGSCGVGSATMVLNALDILRPSVEEYFDYTLYTPPKFLESVKNVIQQEEIKAGFMNLHVLAESLKLFSVDANVIYADALSGEDFRSLLKATLNDSQSFLIANYYRPSLGQKGKGNFSPIGAYDEVSDSVLLLDPLRDQYGPFWVPVDDLLKSMHEVDAGGQVRGLISVKRLYTEVFSAQGMQMIKNSQFRADYFTLSRYFETQDHWTYCAVASSVAVMNSLLDRVVFSQDAFFTEEAKKIVKPEEVKSNWRGLTAHEVVQILALYNFSGTFTSANTVSLDAFRETLKIVLNDPEQMIVANYYRPEAGQVGGGHFSPIVAYDQESDSVLIMDTSRYKYPPVWINIHTFFQSLATKDSDGIYRGYLTIRKA